jgi:hypothetical protein
MIRVYCLEEKPYQKRVLNLVVLETEKSEIQSVNVDWMNFKEKPNLHK